MIDEIYLDYRNSRKKFHNFKHHYVWSLECEYYIQLKIYPKLFLKANIKENYLDINDLKNYIKRLW